jgi:hypothetical protein
MGAIVLLVGAGFAVRTAAQDQPAAEESTIATAAGRELLERARAAPQPLPEGETRVLQALVIDVKGKAQWRPGAEAAWQDARVDDLLDPGAEIRTGLRSSLTLRVGQNATVTVDRSTRLDLPQIVQDGAQLRTRAAVRHGRADFKVDQVGLTNDFEVLTPTTTLAVRGTGFGVQWGALEGAAVTGLPTNDMFAIEIEYLLTRLAFALSGGGASRESIPDPVLNALASTVGAPALWKTLLDDETIEKILSGDPRFISEASQQYARRVDQANWRAMRREESINTEFLTEDQRFLQRLCDALVVVFNQFLDGLQDQFDLSNAQFQAFQQLRQEVIAFCEDPQNLNDDALATIFAEVQAFCETFIPPPPQREPGHDRSDPADACNAIFLNIIESLNRPDSDG